MPWNFVFSFASAPSVSWNDLPLETISTLLATDFQDGLSHEEAAARLRLSMRRLGWRKFLVAGAVLFDREGKRVVRVLREGRFFSIPGRQVVPGDVLELAFGEWVPSLARVIEGDQLVWQERGGSPARETLPALGILLRKGAKILSGRARVVAVAAGLAGSPAR